MRKVKVLMVLAVVLAAMVSTPASGYASSDDGRAKSTAPVVVAGPPSSCQKGYVCLYAHANYLGWNYWVRAGNAFSNFTASLCPPEEGCSYKADFNDVASSWYNNTDMKYCVSWGINGGNPDNTMPPHSYGNFTADWNDQASSIGFINCP